MPRELFFIRHAVPASEARGFRMSSLSRDMRGKQDPPLAARGRAQARALAPHLARLEPERIVSSTLARAAETAGVLAENIGIPHTDRFPELKEITPGALPGTAARQLAAWATVDRLPRFARRRAGAALYRGVSTYYFIQWLRGHTRGGDEPAQVEARIHRTLAALDEMPEERIAVVGHGYWIFYMVFRCLRPTLRYAYDVRPWVENCSVTTLEKTRNGGYRLARFARGYI